jgi:hypothetical protein
LCSCFQCSFPCFLLGFFPRFCPIPPCSASQFPPVLPLSFLPVLPPSVPPLASALLCLL